jgi:hypothetical protein
MPPHPRSRQTPAQPRSFEVQLQPCVACEPVVLCTAPDADRATLAFHAERQRLITHQIPGELLVIRHDAAPHTLLRESLGETKAWIGPAPGPRRN